MSDENSKTEPRTWGMTRASTLKQVASPAVQRETILAACKSFNLGDPTFLDEPLGTSGRSKKFAERPQGNFILRTLRDGDTLVVTDLERMGRNIIDQYTTVDTLFSRGVRIIILKGWAGRALDLRSAQDRMFILIMAWFSEIEGERIAERTRAGLKHRRDNGLCAGRRSFHYIQAYSADGDEIPTGEYSKQTGCFKRNLPDTKILTQLCELLTLQRTINARGRFLFQYCQERGFRDCRGREWWRGTVYSNGRSEYSNNVNKAVKRVRRMAVMGQLPDEWNTKILQITGDDPVTVARKWKKQGENHVQEEACRQ